MQKRWLRLGLVATSMVAACEFSQGFLARDGGGPGDVLPDASPCTSLASECISDTLRVCTQVGAPPMDFPCGWGCVAGDPARCAAVIPSGSGGNPNNGVRPNDVVGDGLGDVTLGDGVTIDSDNGRIGTTASPNLHHSTTPGIENGIDFQFRGPLSMFRFKSLTITGTVTIIGRRPTAFVADGAIQINGILDGRGLCSSNIGGPGGFNGGSTQGSAGQAPAGTMAGGEGATASSGGGGGGHGTSGGSGKDADAGLAFGDAVISVLVGGAGGGAGGGGGMFGRGGGGGGALQLISNTRVVVPAGGGINAGGCGGESGDGNSDSGGGGGAGGVILIEAPRAQIAGTLAVNGGGGGGGGGAAADQGSDGSLGRTPAPGGPGDAIDEGGGSGGAGATLPTAGAAGSNPGGGGGAIGRIRINTRDGSGSMLDGATLSPAPGDPNTTFSTGSAVAQ